MAPGSALPLPAMSCALPCATEENNIGEPIDSPAVRLKAKQLGGDVALVVQHHDEGVAAFFAEHGVGAERARDRRCRWPAASESPAR